MDSKNQWQPFSYDQKLGFVSEFGKDLLSLLNPSKDEIILDLGCGTGDLTYEISRSGAQVIGLDASAEMIGRAKEKYPDIQFCIGDAQHFNLLPHLDAVFSNAALHWMRDAEGVAKSVWNALKPGGRFVAEFGGANNVSTIVHAITDVLTAKYGIDAAARNPWYFPSPGEYCTLLEKQGFIVRLSYYFDRPTRLQDGEDGMLSWLAQFGDDFFQGLGPEVTREACLKIGAKVREALWRDGAIYADYKRLRVVAEKPADSKTLL
ncbi:methyltransferase domain-containing protein [Paenibacillus sp. KQZ6P-2]|uniref:Methyltransferase domain-containing protein n=1 Tax=Paenibacillus mangrovi TaxID=2931978 RepID=A0A9X1WR82_9BACL|nr:methyltransferase domain-containing protein [Paenibacillus mangrovi]MCJ8013827.1 methyltransferase domain-containing protein [Paenibacillus mangrovi]